MTTLPHKITLRSTLRNRLLEVRNAVGLSDDAKAACLAMAEDAMQMALFDAWLDGPWLGRKERMYDGELAFAVGLFLSDRDSLDSYAEYRVYYIDHYDEAARDAVDCADYLGD